MADGERIVPSTYATRARDAGLDLITWTFDPLQAPNANLNINRLGVEIRGQAPISSNGIVDFVPVGGDPLFERRIVDNDTCFACHDIINFHGGPRTDIDYCVTCHNPGSTDANSSNFFQSSTFNNLAVLTSIWAANTAMQKHALSINESV